MSFLDAVRRGLRLARTWQGRDTPAEFWPYALAVFVGFTVIGNIGFLAGVIATVSASRDTRMIVLLAITAVAGLVFVALLAAAVIRRLRDRGRSGVWALVPLVLLVVAGAVQAIVLVTLEEDSGPGLFLVGFVLTLLYFAALVALVVQLALPAPREPVAR